MLQKIQSILTQMELESEFLSCMKDETAWKSNIVCPEKMKRKERLQFVIEQIYANLTNPQSEEFGFAIDELNFFSFSFQTSQMKESADTKEAEERLLL